MYLIFCLIMSGYLSRKMFFNSRSEDAISCYLIGLRLFNKWAQIMWEYLCNGLDVLEQTSSLPKSVLRYVYG